MNPLGERAPAIAWGLGHSVEWIDWMICDGLSGLAGASTRHLAEHAGVSGQLAAGRCASLAKRGIVVGVGPLDLDLFDQDYLRSSGKWFALVEEERREDS